MNVGTIELNYVFSNLKSNLYKKKREIYQSIHLNGIKALQLTKTLKIVSYHIIS